MKNHRALLIFAVLALLHLTVVVSVLSQPIPGLPRISAAAGRSLIWRLHNDTIHRRGPGADFFAVYRAGLHSREGRSVYSGHPIPDAPFAYPYRYLPAVGQSLGRALALLEPGLAYWTWALVLELMLGLICWQFWRLRVSRVRRGLACGLLLVSTPYFLELHMGQFTFVTCALVACATLVLDRRSRHQTPIGGLSLAAAALLKVFPLVALPALLREKHSTRAALIAIAVLALSCLPWFLTHPRDWEEFLARNMANLTEGMNVGNYGLLYAIGLLTTKLGVTWDSPGWHAFARQWQIAVLGVSAIVIWLSRARNLVLGVSAMMLAHFLSYVHVWEHHMSGALIFALLTSLSLERAGDRGRATIAAVAAVCLALPTPFALLDTSPDPTVWNPGIYWPFYQRLLLAASKWIPVSICYGLCIEHFARAGLIRPGASGASGRDGP